MQMQMHITDERGRRRRATVSYDAFDHQVAWVAEVEGEGMDVPLSGMAADEDSVAPAVQVAALRWGIASRR
ncbi:hypothetical protein L2Y96_13785 [Luteibacter aegosomaticola]|uniref:hypothetical protein n=1 Tax=Luteibacter aegosomaticola TaxID=2911538 RepID=UPI001FFA42E2|nr:hypothetical protein [Luteibacter aegosomaticola]UPG88489.1 hypothetical protein L2Y96_13785 [Luteibacter aegosomaticola]